MPDLQDIVSTVAAPVLAGVNVASRAIGDFLNPAVKRLSASGLLGTTSRALSPSVRFFDGQSRNDNWKVRIRISQNSPILYNVGNGLLDPIKRESGIIFPYTPTISTTYQAVYTTQRFTHSNYNHQSFDNSEVQSIQITADFTAQNQDEAEYVLACIYFFRAATKMFFGKGELAGNPPPIVFLNGYGSHYFPDVPCIVTSFTHTMPSEVDYIEAGGGRQITEPSQVANLGELGINTDLQKSSSAGKTRIPTISQFQITLQPVYSKESLTEFDLNEFAQGKLINKGFI
jgi:hypothetical protein